uniref:Uncharacterized protein n=1 Tax=Peronospora matthiolae TaxID=2874970 RepID=A0AAV1UK39_9STRA
MNMLDDEDDQSFHATRDGYSHLSDVEWDAVERMGSIMGIHAVSVMLEALNRDDQHATIAKFIQNELDAEREKVALLHQQGSQQAELLREQGARQFELLRKHQAAAGGSMHSRRPETLKIDISKYRGVEEDSLLRWFVELDDHKGASHRRRGYASCTCPVKSGWTCQDLGTGAQVARPLCVWVVGSLQVAAQTNV